ncbi:hypothetical protein Leryth_012537 [Lithospermum erythrorhizon]|uniref:MAPK kinase substrate protein n=1 Tax=Lithospermum erythrorhizon TaxID=34254 RepID=A0AAV3PM55_LITER|nr:hypothetical protein Leryth_012537 [Lithospermum erythrorhizon]
MDGLQRSEISFRRSGSSGLVWDDKVLSGELTKIATKSEDDKATNTTMKRSRSNGGGKERAAYRAANVEPSADPPSPKVSGCCASVFGKPAKSTQQPPQKTGGRRRK